MKALLLALAFTLSVAAPVSGATAPLALAVYPMCASAGGFLWEIESNGPGLVDVSTSPTFLRKHRESRIVRVTAGDTFFWTGYSPVYVRDRGDKTNVIVATASGDRC